MLFMYGTSIFAEQDEIVLIFKLLFELTIYFLYILENFQT